MKTVVLLVIVFVASFFVAKYWFLGWLDYGILPAPPSFLTPFWPTDGEGVYDRTATEMLIIVELLALSLTLYLLRK